MTTPINTNITSTVANSLNSLNLHSATRSFQQAKRPVEEIEKEIQLQLNEDKALIDNPKTLMASLTPEHIREMKEVSQKIGEDLTDEDIQYALKYGRSVIADYSV